MPIKIVVPELGESVVEATVAEWLKKEGDQVAAGEALVKLETDKVDLEVAAERAGVLAHIEQAAGTDVKVGDVLATLEEAGAGPGGGAGGSAAPAGATGEPAAARHGSAQGRDGKAQPSEAPGLVTPEGAPDERQELEAAEAETAPASGSEGQEVATAEGGRPGEEKATPVARRMAQDLGVDLNQVRGTGPQGRVTKDDLEGYLQSRQAATAAPQARAAAPPAAAPATPPAPTPAAEPPPARPSQAGAPPRAAAPAQPGREEERVRMSRRRQTIAVRLVEAQRTAAMLTTFNEIDMSAVMDVRKRRRDSFKERWGVGLGFMSFFVKASIGALRSFPRLNAEIQGNEFVLKHYYDTASPSARPTAWSCPCCEMPTRCRSRRSSERSRTLPPRSKTARSRSRTYAVAPSRSLTEECSAR